MRILHGKMAATAGALFAVWLLIVIVGAWRVHDVTHPPREPVDGIDFDSLKLSVDEISFRALDGVRLSGWMLPGADARPPILLCHDLGSSRGELLTLAISLQSEGHPVLLFDFRAHGASQGASSTLGMAEKRDILGALDYLAMRDGRVPRQVGIYAVGMGAHAAVLAAAERPALNVLVLDTLYRDASVPLSQGVFADWHAGARRLGFISNGLFELTTHARISSARAADVLPQLSDREMLLMASEKDPFAISDMQRMVNSLAVRPDIDGNLLVLPAVLGEGLYGAQREAHHRQVVEFLVERLATDERSGSASVSRRS